MEDQSKNKRLAKNTLFLYFRMFITMGVSLYTSRVVLNVLGVEDYGIYNVVGGIVAMFSMLTATLSSSSQRFLTFELGKRENSNIREIFSTTVTIHNIIAFVVFILAETIGLWFLNLHMNINPNRMEAANWVYQTTILSFIITISSVPYNAALIAYEQMKAFAYISVLEVGLKLAVVYLLFILPFDKLKIYSVLIMLVILIVRLIYSAYCRHVIKECRYVFHWNKLLFKEILSFAGWNFIGSSSYVLMTQGVNVLLNIFWGVLVNAAQGIAAQVQNATGSFVNNFMMALNPQITKSYASGDRQYMFNLIEQGARFSYFLMLFLSLPLIFETPMILHIWLKIVPDYAVTFVRLSLIFTLSQTLSNTLVTGLTATGKIKKYQMIVGGLLLLNFPISYIVLKIGLSPSSVYIVSIFISFVALFARLLMAREMIGLAVVKYLKNVVLNVISVTMLTLVIPILFLLFLDDSFLRLIIVTASSMISLLLVVYILGLSKNERQMINSKISKYISK